MNAQPLASLSIKGRPYFYYGVLDASRYPNKMLPVLFVFHGGGESPQEIMEYTGFFLINALVIAPFGQPSYNGHSWQNAFPWMFQPDVSDVSFVQQIIQEIPESINGVEIDRECIFATGKSDGAGFTIYLATHTTIQLRAIAVCSSALFCLDSGSDFGPLLRRNPTIPVLAVHGTEDSIMPYEGQKFENSAALEHCFVGKWHTIDPSCQKTFSANIFNYWRFWGGGNPLEEGFINNQPVFYWENNIHIRIVGGDHDWAGHINSGPNSDSTSNLSFDATAAICKFFNINFTLYQPTVQTDLMAIPNSMSMTSYDDYWPIIIIVLVVVGFLILILIVWKWAIKE